MSIIFEAMPFIVIGALVSGALEELLPQQFFARWLPKNRMLAIASSSLMGMFLPMCECGIVPVMRRLLRKGVPASCAITYMLSAPVINPIVLASTALAFWTPQFTIGGVPGLGMVLLRAGTAFATAVTVGMVIERLTRKGVPVVLENAERVRLIEGEESQRLLEKDKALSLHVLAHAPGEVCTHEHEHGPDCDHGHEHHEHKHEHAHGECSDHNHDHAEHHHDHAHPPAAKRSLLDRLTAIADIALGDFLDIAAFLVIGAALAATVNTMLSRDRLDVIADMQTVSIVAMMGLAFLLSLCSEADAFVAANFTSTATGAKLAFLVLGPMLDVKLYIMYRWVFTRRAVWTMIPVLAVTIFLIANGVNIVAGLLSNPAASSGS